MNNQSPWRSVTVGILLAVIGLSIIIQIIRIQTSPEAKTFIDMSRINSGQQRVFYPARGDIYDRKGHQFAGNKMVYEIGVDLPSLRHPDSMALALSVHLGMDYNELYANLTNPPEKYVYLTIANYVPFERADALIKLQENLEGQVPPDYSLEGLVFTPRLQRSYPEKNMACNLIGFVSREGRGYFGVEEKYNELLAGQPVKTWVPNDPNRVGEIPQIPDGTTLILTIDRDLQASVEEILDESLVETGAKSGTIVVMDPRNGDILAMATTPRLDLNRFWEYGTTFNNASEFNRAISMPYEPGSVFKILTMAAGLDTGKVQPGTVFLDTGGLQVNGTIIKNWDKQAWGPQNMIGCLQHSLNTCLAWVATEVGPQAFYDYMKRFGVGHPTGIDMAGEAAGRLKVPGDEDWYPVDLATNSFGQGVAVTPIQMLTAVSAVANEGKMVTPHTLYAMVKGGHQYNTSPQYTGTPISADTARTLNEMLAISLEQESSLALVPGYRVAGKTGTAQIPTKYGYDFGVTNTSFIGWGPVDQPQVMIYVWLEEPSSSIWGSETAAPVFSEVMQRAVILLNIPPDQVRRQVAGQ